MTCSKWCWRFGGAGQPHRHAATCSVWAARALPCPRRATTAHPAPRATHAQMYSAKPRGGGADGRGRISSQCGNFYR